MEKDFYKTKSLQEMTDEEWESLCDGCGMCCYRKFIDGHGKKTKLYYTSIACNFLDLKTGLCSDYCNRFKLNKECIHLTKKNVTEFNWLPETCAYRLLYEGKEIPSWHPLVTGIPLSKNQDFIAQVKIKNLIHEEDVEDWKDFVTKEESMNSKK